MRTSTEEAGSGRARHEWTILLVLAAVLAIHLGLAATLHLSDDEAWYWALSGKPRLSYFVHPPLGIWLISLSTAVFGNTAVAVRLPAVLCSTAAVYRLIRLADALGWAGGAWQIAAAMLSAPLLLFGGILSGPDLPLVLFWIGAMEASLRLEAERFLNLRTWVALGIFLGLGLLSKYTALLGAAAATAWLCSSAEGRRQLRTARPYLSAGLALLLFSPVLLWNAKHDWSSFRYQLVERHELDLNVRRWAIAWLAQLATFGPALVCGWFALIAHLRRRHAGLRFLALWALIPAVVFWTQPLVGSFKVHWPLPAYLPVVVFFAGLPALGARSRVWRGLLAAGGVLTVVGLLCLYLPLIPLVFGGVDPKTDVSNDFYGWEALPSVVSRLPPGARALPIVTARYQIASQAAFAFGSTARVSLIPHTAHELADWGGPERAPPRFLYLTDNRYAEPAESLFAGYHCQRVTELRTERAGFLAKSLRLELCRTCTRLRTKSTSIPRSRLLRPRQ